ncbi:MAG: c-type cytochrome, partial [Actinomycetota bacterium]|nr:c-type cytochrome [Actinomycetota bacterium]
QWWWEYEYEAFNIVTANELHIPANQPVQLEITSADVIHNFWPPKLAGKVDAIPGRTNFMKLEADRPGDYSGQCAEYCGLSHANMRLRVVSHAPEDFRAWVRGQQQAAAPAAAGSDAAAGAELFVFKGCTGCHTVAGLQGANGRVGPDLTHFASRDWFAGAIFETNEKNLRLWLRDPPGQKPMVPDNGQGMPNLGLTEEEITSLIAYLETLK